MGKILSIEIDNKCIKIIEASRKINGEFLSIGKSLLIDVPDNCIIDGKIINLDFIKSEIENAFLCYKIKTRKVIFVISPNLVIMRKIKLPILKSKFQTLSMIKLEFEQMLSTNLNQIIIYRKVDATDCITDIANNESMFIVSGLAFNTCNQYIELSKQLKLNPIALLTSSNCLEKISENELMINENVNFKGTYAFVKILCNYIVFCVIKNDVNDFTRIIDLKTDNTKFYEPDRVAEPLDDFNYKANSNQQETNVDINVYVDEISKNIRYYNSMDKDNDIEKIYIYGDSKDSKIDGFKDNLLSETNKDVEIIKDIKDIKKINKIYNINNTNEINKSNLNYNKEEFDKIKYLHGFLSLFTNLNDINFLSNINKKRKNMLIIYGVSIVSVLCVFIIVIFYFKKDKIKNDLYKDEMISMNLFINEQDNIEINNKVEKTKNEVVLLEEYKNESLKFIEIMRDKNIVSSEILREIQNNIPTGTEVTSTIMGRNNIQMQCKSFGVEEIILLLDNLRHVSSVNSVYVPLIKYNDSNNYNYSYSIICKFGDVGFNEIK